MTLTPHALIAFLLTLIAVLYQIECDSNRWKSLESAVILTTPDTLARFITNTDTTKKWFHWVSYFKEADSRPISKGKKYQAFYNVPFLGEYMMLFRLTEYKPNELYMLESDGFLKPRLALHLSATSESATKLSFSLEFRRTSALYHFTVGPLLWFLSNEQLRHSLLLLKMMFPF